MGYQEGWGIWLNAAGATDVDPGQGLHLDSSLTAFELAAQGGGVALGRRSVAAALRASGRLTAPFALEVPIDEAFYLLKPLGGHSHLSRSSALRKNPLRAAISMPVFM